jgi:hypothetical protein
MVYMSFTFLTSFTFTGNRARTIFGWTPGLRALVGNRVLPCGCSVGRYETLASELVDILDAHGERCVAPAHALHAILSRLPPPGALECHRTPSAPVDDLQAHPPSP